MKGNAFLIAASKAHDYHWVIVPDLVPAREKGNVLQQLPEKVVPELRIIELTCGDRKLWAAMRIERTIDKEGKQLLDEVGRPLRHTFGAMFSERIGMDVAASEISRLTPRIKENLSTWLASSLGANTLPNSMPTGGKRPPDPRSRWPIVVGAAAIILSIAMGASNLSLRQQIAELGATLGQTEQTVQDQKSKAGKAEQIIQKLQTKLEKAEQTVGDQENKIGNAEQIIQNLQTKLEKAEQTVRDLQPKPGMLPRGVDDTRD
jgi:hypothetical protein